MRVLLSSTVHIFLFALFIMSSLFGISQDKYYATIPESIMTYNLPSGRNGLAETTFRLSGHINIIRGENSSQVEVFIDWSEGTASNLNPAFKFDYVYQGVHYGDQHLGRDPFYGISVEKQSVKFKTVIMYRSQTINWESNYVLGNIVGRGPADLEARDVAVFIKEITWVGFKGTNRIEEQIRAIAAENKKKENYSKLIKEGDQYMNQKNWSFAVTKYESASSLFPEESYPQTQLSKINDLKKAEITKTQPAPNSSTSTGNNAQAPAKGNIPNTSSSSSTTASASANKSFSGSGQTSSSSYNSANANLPKYGRDNAGKYYDCLLYTSDAADE